MKSVRFYVDMFKMVNNMYEDEELNEEEYENMLGYLVKAAAYAGVVESEPDQLYSTPAHNPRCREFWVEWYANARRRENQMEKEQFRLGNYVTSAEVKVMANANGFCLDE